MIVGTGLDAVRIDRIRRALSRSPDRFKRRVFTPLEIAQCQAGRRPESEFARRFAAKEAVFKALATGWGRGGRWLDIETRCVASEENSGGFDLRLAGRAHEVATKLGMVRSHVSIGGGRTHAMAFVVLEGSRT